MTEEDSAYSFDYDPRKEENDYLSDLNQLYKDYSKTFLEWTPPFREMELEFQIEKNETALIEKFGYEPKDIRKRVSEFRSRNRRTKEDLSIDIDHQDIDIDEL